MSRSVTELRHELKAKERVQIPQVTRQQMLDTLTLGPAIALGGLLIILLFEYHWGRTMVGGVMIVLGVATGLWALWDWSKRILVLPQTLKFHNELPVPFSDIEHVGIPANPSVLNVHLTPQGMLNHYPDARETDPERVADADNRILTWRVNGEISDEELTFIQELVKQSS